MAFEFSKMMIPDVVVITPRIYGDERGFLMEAYKRSEFEAHGIDDIFVQDNYSYSIRGTLRGLHYQKRPKTQAKLVSVIRGDIFDVAVDIRVGSPTYGKWVGITLTANDHQLVYVPAGFAHGFCVLSEEAVVMYKVTREYAPEYEGGIIWNDPDISTKWPVSHVFLSPRDSRLPKFRSAIPDFHYLEVL